MISARLEKRASIYISVLLSTTILIVTTFMSIEPVNAPKMLILAIMGIASWVTVFSIGLNKLFKTQKFTFVVILIFTLLVLANLITSDAALVQTFYGTFGRNTGALTYFSLAGLLFLIAQFRSKDSLGRLTKAIIVAGILNLIYCGIDIIGPDLLGWNNQYGEILGTLGNPNFISAFLGLFSALILPYAFQRSYSLRVRLLVLLIELITVLEIIQSRARQGFIIYLLGISVCIFYWLASKENLKKVNYFYLPTILTLGLFGLLGLLQKGPLAPYIYKGSISYRGVYWEAGAAMGAKFPATGIGFDAYGDYYREFRSAQSVISPGVTVTTNTSHNVVIDIFAAGGLPLLLSYLSVMILGLLAIIRITKKSKDFEVLKVSLISGWLAYQVQSLFSINQIGLAICGWVLTGALIAYSRISLDSDTEIINSKSKLHGKSGLDSSAPLAIGALIGLVVAVPPVLVDANWKSALERGDGARITEVAQQWPRDAYRTNQIAIPLESSGLTDQSLMLARQNIVFSPRNFDAWRILSQVTKSSPEEKTKSLEMMRKLDPRNTELN
jgi:hypothetical protein